MKPIIIIFSLVCVTLMALAITACGDSSSGGGDSDSESAGVDVKSGVEVEFSTQKNEYGYRCACVSLKNNTGTDWFGYEPSFHFVSESKMDEEQKKLYDEIKETLYDSAKEDDDDDFDFENEEISIEGDGTVEGLIKDGATSDKTNLVVGDYYILTHEDVSKIVELDTIKVY